MKPSLSCLVLSALLCACATHESSVSGALPVACIGEVLPPPSGMMEVQDPALLQRALGQPLQGKLCAGKVFRASEGAAVTVYRVWDASKPYTAMGSWWSFSAPQGSRDTYRAANEICPQWSALDRVTQCRLKPGAEVVSGPGQSAQCDAALTYPPSPANQVFVPNDARKQLMFVENCTMGTPWPTFFEDRRLSPR